MINDASSQLFSIQLTHLLMSGKRILHITNPGLRPQLVDIAPDAENSPSKRYALIANEVRYPCAALCFICVNPSLLQDQNLEKNLKELEEGTKARNREFQDRLVGYFVF